MLKKSNDHALPGSFIHCRHWLSMDFRCGAPRLFLFSKRFRYVFQLFLPCFFFFFFRHKNGFAAPKKERSSISGRRPPLNWARLNTRFPPTPLARGPSRATPLICGLFFERMRRAEV